MHRYHENSPAYSSYQIQDFWQNIVSHKLLSHHTVLVWFPALCLFLKLKPLLQGRRLQVADEFQENATGQLMTIPKGYFAQCGRCIEISVRSLKDSTSKGKLFSQKITWLDTFCTYLIFTHTKAVAP